MDNIKPMLADTAQEIFDNQDYIFDLKFNGMRIVGHKDGDNYRLQARRGLDYTSRFPELAGLVGNIKTDKAIVDGEVVCLGTDGLPDFNALQQRSGKTDPIAVRAMMPQFPAVYHIFDVVQVDTFSLVRGAPAQATQIKRREVLARILAPDDKVKLATYVDGKGIEMMEKVKKLNEAYGRQVFDGVMAKKKSGLYYPGGRPADWQKLKIPQFDNFVICGYTKGTGWREDTFGAVVLARPENGGYRWVGCAGSGFDSAGVRDMYQRLLQLQTPESPFPIDTKVPGLLSWVQPVMVCYIKYYDVTKTGQLIWPIFQHSQPMFTPEDITRD
jgi:bifunctional non-homologous end joining protein LigD